MTDVSLIAKTSKPVVTYLKLPEGQMPYLEGWRCSNCDEVFVEARSVCSNCFQRDQMIPVKLSGHGRVYNWTIVYRDFPGIKVPFISVIVDLDGGGTVKGNLIDMDPDPAKVAFDMPVKIVYRPLEQKDAAGNTYVGYFFVPAIGDGESS